jgi:hypothetical protein
MSTQKTIAFLFGSGISIKAGLPPCSEITTGIFAGKSITRSAPGRWTIGTRDFEVDERILCFLQLLKAEADIYFYGQRQSNYEDLFYMIWQILGTKCGQVENPAANPLINEVDRKFGKIYGPSRGMTPSEEHYTNWRPRKPRLQIRNLAELAGEAYNYVRDYVCAKLTKDAPNVDYFQWIAHAMRDKNYAQNGHKQRDL